MPDEDYLPPVTTFRRWPGGYIFCPQCGHLMTEDTMHIDFAKSIMKRDFAVIQCRTVRCPEYEVGYKLPYETVLLEKA